MERSEIKLDVCFSVYKVDDYFYTPGVGVGFLLVGIPVGIAGNRYIAKAPLYNNGIQQDNVTAVHFRLGFNPTRVMGYEL